jgi:hypothetical protein
MPLNQFKTLKHFVFGEPVFIRPAELGGIQQVSFMKLPGHRPGLPAKVWKRAQPVFQCNIEVNSWLIILLPFGVPSARD